MKKFMAKLSTTSVNLKEDEIKIMILKLIQTEKLLKELAKQRKKSKKIAELTQNQQKITKKSSTRNLSKHANDVSRASVIETSMSRRLRSDFQRKLDSSADVSNTMAN